MRTLDLNLRGVMLAIQLALPLMPAGGAIVNVASVAGLGYGTHRAPDYAVAKAGLIRLTGCLAALRDSHGIRVNCVCPDLTDTPSSRRDRASMTAAQRAAAPPALPPEEIADAVTILLTDPARGPFACLALCLILSERPFIGRIRGPPVAWSPSLPHMGRRAGEHGPVSRDGTAARGGRRPESCVAAWP
jgi:hypothetical protein